MINVCVQYIIENSNSIPSKDLFSKWSNAANIDLRSEVELTIRIVTEGESADLNAKYRNTEKATNVLAFPFDVDENVELNLLGDLVICSDVVKKEAIQQLKTENQHWAHMVVHGVLHLQGYDHIEAEQAIEMENLEVTILDKLGFDNPYLVNNK